MKLAALCFLSIFASGLSRHALSQEEDWLKRYETRTLKSVVEAVESELSDMSRQSKTDFFIDTDSHASRVRLIYAAKTRPLPDGKKKLLKLWATSIRRPEAVDSFATEALFREGKEEYWIAVQNPLMHPLTEEVKPGGSLDAYLVIIGADVRNSKSHEWLFAMNEFEAH